MCSHKVCYIKLLVTVQEGKAEDEVDKTIKECFPDINIPVDEVRLHTCSSTVA